VLSDEKVELAFLDIQLRESTIFSVLEKLFLEGKPLPELVFTTAHGSFENALKAIQFACLDFVTKPYGIEDIEQAIQRFLNKKEIKHHQRTDIGFLLQLLRNDIQSPKTMAVQLQRGIIEIVDLANMLYIEADENISIVHLSNNQKLHSSKNFGHYLGLLTDKKEFVQIGKSCLVNLNHVKQYNHQDKSLRLKNNESLVVSHRFSKSLHKYLLNNQKNLVNQGMFDFLKGLFRS
ncbi:MAG TPA: LytTR family DNA-binding domain-containing protein, partial [Bacteroidia bacterium]|nr:LytTR family DNA-binding domain-containing protein [Bacteroidia bacterium]